MKKKKKVISTNHMLTNVQKTVPFTFHSANLEKPQKNSTEQQSVQWICHGTV